MVPSSSGQMILCTSPGPKDYVRTPHAELPIPFASSNSAQCMPLPVGAVRTLPSWTALRRGPPYSALPSFGEIFGLRYIVEVYQVGV